jgi:hypothetical protein
MNYLFAAIVLLFCAPVLFVNEKLLRVTVPMAVIALILGGLSCYWSTAVSKDFFVEHPALFDTPLHPTIASLAGGILLLFGVGLFLALGCRYLIEFIEKKKSGRL